MCGAGGVASAGAREGTGGETDGGAAPGQGLPPVRVATLNVSGLNNREKRWGIFSFLRDRLKAQVVLLSETHLSDEAQVPFWSQKWGVGRDDGAPRAFWSRSDSPHTGGAAVLFHPSLPITVKEVERDPGPRGRWVRVRVLLFKREWTFTAVYAPAQAAERVQFMSKPEWAKPDGLGALAVVGGDFNCVEDVEMDVVRRPKYENAGGSELCKWVEAGGWQDGDRVKRRASAHSNMTFVQEVGASRLDRIYVGAGLDRAVRSVETQVCALSDHRAVVMLLTEGGKAAGAKSYSKCFTANREVVESQEGRAKVQEAIDLTMQGGEWERMDHGDRWVAVKEAIQLALMKVAQERARRLKGSKTAADQVLQSLQHLTRQRTPSEQQQWKAALETVRSASLRRGRGAATRCRCRWLAKGERCTSYFLRLERSRRAPPGDLAVRVGERVVRSRVGVARAMRKVWRDVFTEPSRSVEESRASTVMGSKFLGYWRKQIPAPVRRDVNAVITMEEASKVVRKLRSAASPGPDGLPASVLKLHWDQLGEIWLAMVTEGVARGRLHVKVVEGKMVMLPKGEGMEVRRPGQHRPITLLNADYKLLAAILTARLNRVTGRLVHKNQTGFVRGRYIGDNVILLRDYLEWCRERKMDRGVVFCDFAKAYDRVRWEWLWRVLDHVGLGEGFSGIVKACYGGAKVVLALDGMTLGDITPTRGVRQGCPMSPLLFALTVEALHSCLRVGPGVRGVELPRDLTGRRPPPLRASMFADDLTLFPADERDARRMLGVVKEFGVASGSKLNLDKTLVLPTRVTRQQLFAGLQVVKAGEKVKGLGVLYGPGLPPSAQWARVMDTMRRRTKAWARHQSLSVVGRVVAANSMIASVASYLAAFTSPTAEQLKELDGLVWAAVWGKDGSRAMAGKKGGWLSIAAAELPRSEAGLGLLLPSTMIRSRRLAMLNRALTRKGDVWTIYLQDKLRRWPTKWAQGWEKLLTKLPKGGISQSAWAPAIREWQRLEWAVDRPTSVHEMCASPLWHHPHLPRVAQLRTEQHAGAMALVKCGATRVGDVWDRGHRRWNAPTPPPGWKATARTWRAVEEAMEVIKADVQRWLGPATDRLLYDATPPPLPGTWWWDEDAEDSGGRGGIVVATRRCAHCPEEFGGYDVLLAIRPVEVWGQPTSTPEERAGGELFNPNQKWVCGYEGSPLGVHYLKRGNERTVVCAAPVLQEGINPTAWYVRDALYRCSMLNPGRDARRAIRSSEAARSKKRPPNVTPLQRWSEWGGTSPLAVKHHLLAAHKTVGIPAKARQLCLRLLWWKITWSGPGATARCYVCRGLRQGEGEENHTFFTCPATAGVWETARGKLAAAGVIIPRGREWIIGSRTLAPQDSTLPVMAIWRLVWVGCSVGNLAPTRSCNARGVGPRDRASGGGDLDPCDGGLEGCAAGESGGAA